METPITAKVLCTSKIPNGEDTTTLYFLPDYANGANAEWAKYTPYLSLTITVLNSVADKFELGRPITLTFEHC